MDTMDLYEYVYYLTRQIPKGMVSSYGTIAKALGDIRASRGVGEAEHLNPTAVIMPCHRVVYSDGGLGGYGGTGGQERKIELLAKEGIKVENYKIVDFENVLFQDFQTEYPLKKLRAIQVQLRKKIVIENGSEANELVKYGGYIAGIDVAYSGWDGYGACVIMGYPGLELEKVVTVKTKVKLPYIPTYLGFREFSVVERLVEKVKKLNYKPLIYIFDGNGILHPYGMGLASHVGVALNIPTVGAAKGLLCGTLDNYPTNQGEAGKIIFEDKHIGFGFRSSLKAKKLIYVSPGHNVSKSTALEIVRTCCRTRIPEPVREAHKAAGEFKKVGM
jgi:deoxyribonuclease V